MRLGKIIMNTKLLHTSVVSAAAVAAGLLVFFSFFGRQPDKQQQEFFESAGVVETFRQGKVSRVSKDTSESSPLVKQAVAFGLYLNPPRPKKPARRPSAGRPRPQKVSAKFTLIGTSFYESHPDKSLALINQPGKPLQWIKQSGKVGHLVIEQIGDGFVLIRDGSDVRKLSILMPEKPNLVKSSSSAETSKDSAGSSGVPSGVSASQKDLDVAETGRRVQISREATEEQKQMMDEFMSKIKKANIDADADSDAEKKRAMMDEFVKRIRTGRMSSKQAKQIRELGQEMNDISAAESEPNDVKNGENESKNDKNGEKEGEN